MSLEAIEHVMSATEAALDHLRRDDAFQHPMVVRLARDDTGYGVSYDRARSGDLVTTFAGFSFAVRREDADGIRKGVLDYDAHHGFRFKPAA